MESEKPLEINITSPQSTAFIFQEVNRREWCKRLDALAKELVHLDYKFALTDKGHPLDVRSKIRLATAIAKAEVVSKNSARPEVWDEITADYVSDGYAVAVLDEVLSVLAEQSVHLVRRHTATGSAQDIPIARVVNTESRPPEAPRKGLVALLVGGAFFGAIVGVSISDLLMAPNPPAASQTSAAPIKPFIPSSPTKDAPIIPQAPQQEPFIRPEVIE